MITRLRAAARRQKQHFRAPELLVTYLYRHDLRTIPTISPGLPCEFRPVTLEQIDLLRDVWSVPLDRMRQRIQKGHFCYGVFAEGRIAHYLWLQVGGRHYMQPTARHLHLADDEAMFYHVRVAEWAQGRHLAAYGYTQALQHCRQLACRAASVYTTQENLASQKSIERAGWVFHEGYRALRLGHDQVLALPGKLEQKS